MLTVSLQKFAQFGFIDVFSTVHFGLVYTFWRHAYSFITFKI